jgi:hypothetical protein
VTASVAGDTAAVVAAVFAEADRRDPGHERPWIALADGNKDQIARIKAEAAARGITVTIICDLIHATGVIEGACRHLVKDRMDITGARWGAATAEAILKLRAIITNGDFDAYWAWHLQREHERNHPGYALAA